MALGSKVKTWIDPDAIVADAPLPSPADVLYSRPNPDGSRKSCRNCCMFLIDQEACMIVEADLITADMVCGYHVPGRPAKESTLNVTLTASAELAGLIEVKGGTACRNCRWFRDRGMGDGVCQAVIGEAGEPAIVDALGCCARWEAPE